MANKLSQWNPKYELFFIAIKYNLWSIGKMGYKEVDRKWDKARGAHGDDNDDENEPTPADAPDEGHTVAPLVPNSVIPVVTSLD